MYGERGACLWQIKDLLTKYAILTGQEAEDLLPNQIQDELGVMTQQVVRSRVVIQLDVSTPRFAIPHCQRMVVQC